MMAALRTITLVPGQLVKQGFLSPAVRRAQSNKLFSLARKCGSTFGNFSSAYQPPSRFYCTAKTSPKSLAEEILKTRLQTDGGGQQQQDKQDESKTETEEERKKREAAWRTMKWTFVALGVSFTSLGIWVLNECGKTFNQKSSVLLRFFI